MSNADQIEYWNAEMGRVWVQRAAALEHATRPYGDSAIAALDPRAGENVCDVGCGFGPTTFEIGRRVQPGGSVIGVDISRPMLELARQRLAAEGVKSVTFVEADAQTADLGSQAFDALFSRFGIMFFSDPTTAFSNLRRATREGGRLVFTAWKDMLEQAWVAVPVMAAIQVCGPPEMPGPHEPGPFAFADADRIRDVLTQAGWSDVSIDEVRHDVVLPGSHEEAVDAIMDIGPFARMLEGAEDRLPEVRAAVLEATVPYVRDGGVGAEGTAWLVTART